MDTIVGNIVMNIPQQPYTGKLFDKNMIGPELMILILKCRVWLIKTKGFAYSEIWFGEILKIIAEKLGCRM